MGIYTRVALSFPWEDVYGLEMQHKGLAADAIPAPDQHGEYTIASTGIKVPFVPFSAAVANLWVADSNAFGILYRENPSLGIPGDVAAIMIYTRSARARGPSKIEARALTRRTPLMLASHAYWNLDAFANPTNDTALSRTPSVPSSRRLIAWDSLASLSEQLERQPLGYAQQPGRRRHYQLRVLPGRYTAAEGDSGGAGQQLARAPFGCAAFEAQD